MKIIAVTNQKGGVGKTTTAVNLASGLSLNGQSVLLVDLDPQGNATMGVGINKGQLQQKSVYPMLLGMASLADVVVRSEQRGFDVLPANRELAGAEVEIVNMTQREQRLKKSLQGETYDYVIIDCPPSLSLLTLNGLCAASGIIIPMQCEYYALEGLVDLVNTMRMVYKSANPELEILGLLRVMFDSRSILSRHVSEQLRIHYGEKVFSTVIPRNIRLAEAPGYGMPGLFFDRSSKGAQAYLQFAQEVLLRTRGS